MLRHLRHSKRFTGILLAALLFRAYIPVGFMPASGTPFLLELCPAASAMPMSMPMPMPMLAYHHHASGTHAHFDNCPFGSAPAAGPVSHLVVFEPAGRLSSLLIVTWETPRLGVRLDRANQPRGPPSPV